MTDAPLQQTLLTRLRLPEASQKTLSFCKSPTPVHIQQWIESLPLTRINFASAVLYSALPELARLQTDGDSHIKLLEIVRPVAQSCIGALAHTFINQPLILPTHALKAATVAQALQKHLCNAYLGALRDALASDSSQEIVALAIHRALTGFGLLLLRSYQLYTPALSQLWIEIHTLYRLAETQQLLHIPVGDPLTGHRQVKTVEQAYVRILLLAVARPNQLRQQDMASIYLALETLCAQTKVLPHTAGSPSSNHYVVLLDSAQPPVYRARLDLYESEEVRELDARELIHTLSINSKGGGDIPLNPALASHLANALAKPAQRVFERQHREGQLEVSVGLSNAHFHCADGTPFSLFTDPDSGLDMDNSSEGIFKHHGLSLKPEKNAEDPWGEAFEVARPGPTHTGGDTSIIEDHLRRDALERYRGQHPIITLAIADASASGYGLELNEQTTVALKSGDILTVREPGRVKWAIAAVRWVRRGKTNTHLGIQVLAPQAQPAAAAIIQKTGDYAEYQRALILPALRMLGQSETLVTNAISFQEGHKIKLLRGGQVRTAQLIKRIFTTGTISQFTFKELVGSQPDAEKATKDTPNIANLWDDLGKI